MCIAATTAYNAIVLDVMLPGMDGFETCKRLRNDGIWSPVIMLTARRAWRGQHEVSLSAKEFRLLEVFMRHPGEVLTRYQLLEQAWDYDYENRSNIVDVYVRYLRDKIDRPFGVSQLETVRGSGYRLAA